MNVLIISAPCPNKIAGIIARDLYNGLASIPGCNVRVLSKEWNANSNRHFHTYETTYITIIKKLHRMLMYRLINLSPPVNTKCIIDPKYSFHEYDQTITYYTTNALMKKIDIAPNAIIVLFVSYFISFRNLYELYLKYNAPILLYFMDMAPMTGGCHYAWDCHGYIDDMCRNCPAISISGKAENQTNTNMVYKKMYSDMTNIIALSGSSYQYKQIRKSILFRNKRIERIYLPIDEETFRPGCAERAREHFSLPKDKRLILFRSVDEKDKRKGYSELLSALEELHDEQIYNESLSIVAVGDKIGNRKNDIPFSVIDMGILSISELALAFQAVDMFVCPSIEDSGPMMINQSLMCGTPVVAFEMGVALDLVITGKTGYLARMKDCRDFACGIKYVLELSSDQYTYMREYAAKYTYSKCNVRGQAFKILNVIDGRYS